MNEDLSFEENNPINKTTNNSTSEQEYVQKKRRNKN